MASAFFGKAAISKLFYSKTMLTMITGVITISVTTALFPKIAELGQLGKIGQMKERISSSVVSTMLLIIPASIGMAVLSEPIIGVVFERNAFTRNDTIIVAALLTAYAPNNIFQSIVDVVDRGFYAVGDSKTPVIVVLIQQFLNVIFNLIMIKFFGIEGLAYATVLSTAVGTVLMLFQFRKKFGSFNFKSSLISLVKISLATVVMALVAYFTNKALAGVAPRVVALFVAIFLAMLVYGLLILLARIPEVMDMVNRLYHKYKRRKLNK